MSSANQQTLVLIKPDALRNSLTGYVLSLLSEFHTGLRFAATKIVRVHTLLAGQHYAEHQGKVFYASLIDYITGRIHYSHEPEKQRVIAIVYQGENAVNTIREIAGPTNPHQARDERPGCIRSLGTLVPFYDKNGSEAGTRMENLIHASASVAEAEREIKLWFRPNDIPPSMRIYPTVCSTEHFYFKDNRLGTTHEPGTVCLVAPGDSVWQSDYEILESTLQADGVSDAIGLVAAKYLINEAE